MAPSSALVFYQWRTHASHPALCRDDAQKIVGYVLVLAWSHPSSTGLDVAVRRERGFLLDARSFASELRRLCEGLPIRQERRRACDDHGDEVSCREAPPQADERRLVAVKRAAEADLEGE